MKLTDTISVNPSKETLGHVDSKSTIFRSHVLEADHNSSIDMVKVLFPSNVAGINEYKKYVLPLRTLFATILIITGLTMLESVSSVHGTAFAICTICFGGFLALGLMTRLVMAGASVFYCVAGALLLRTGIADMTVFTLMFGCLLFCINGAGKYSLDTLIRHGIKNHRKVSIRKRKEKLLGYKAFHNVRF